MADQPGILRFGVFEVNLAAGELRKNGVRVKLQEQPFQVLAALLGRPGEVVTKEELKERLWAGDTFVDFDHSLSTAVNKIRETLGDSASSPRFIETLPRKGYRFIVKIETGPLQHNASPVTFDPGPRRRQPIAWSLWLTASLVVGCTLIALGVLWRNKSGESSVEYSLNPEPLTYYDGVESEAGFSPDGNQVVFTWNGQNQDNFDVYVKTIMGAEPTRLTTDPARDFSPAWSPDGQWIAFLRETGNGRNGVYRIPALGGREEKLLEVATAPRFVTDVDRYLGWSPGSESLAVVDQPSADEGFSLFLLSISTGRKRRLTSGPKGGRGDSSPSISMDGQSLCFVRARGGESSVYSVSLGADLLPTGDPRPLTLPTRPCFGSNWGRDGNEILFSVGPYRSQLWMVSPESPHTMHALGSPAFAGYLPAYSSNGRRLVYTRRVFEANTWRLDLGADSTGAAPVKVVSSTGYNGNLQFSPDGRQIVFNSDRSGHQGVWICNADGTNQAPLGPAGGGTPRWSPDGHSVAFDLPTSQGDYDIWTVGAQGGPPRQLTQGTADDRVPSWSRDGNWIYFASDRGGGHQLWKKSPQTGEEIQITRDGGLHAMESQDGFLYYTKALGDWSVWKVPVGGGKEEQVLEALSSWTNFALTGNGIYFSPGPRDQRPAVILFYDFEKGSRTEIFRPPKPLSLGMAVSPDGRHLLYSQIDHDGSDLMRVENFR